MKYTTTSVTPAGPPSVITYTGMNTWKANTVDTMSTSVVVRDSKGTVMSQNSPHGDAPSTRAAS